MTAVPEPIVPAITQLKLLHLTTVLVAKGQPQVAIVCSAAREDQAVAERIQAAIRRLTGTTVPLVDDRAPSAAVPLQGNLICLGNRSTNACVSQLYDLFFALIDLKFPGPGGHVLQTVHSPFGDGRNVIYAGGSDAAGVATAAERLLARLDQAAAGPGELSVGRLLEVKLSEGYQPPSDMRQMEIWEASPSLGSRGYFGWNSLSKHMAMFTMTGNPAHAREFLRLAFPDEQAHRELTEIDGELVENKADPLAGSYHYGAHLMILLWDLIEESPVFTDEERLRVTNAFARQLGNRMAYAGDKLEVDLHRVYHLTEPAPWIGTRHNIYHALCLFCLARYFKRYYPDPVWAQALRGTANYFAQLRQPRPFVRGEMGTMASHGTCVAPLLAYVLLSGDRTPATNGALAMLLREQEALLSGKTPDPMLKGASLDYLHKAAHLLRDGRYLTYRDRLGMDTNVFRLGQSFWPEPTLKPVLPLDLVGKWTVCTLSPGEWQTRQSGLAESESFCWASFRTATDGTGDFILLNGRNAFGRHPYFAFAVNELRLGGCTVLQGFRNQVQTKADDLLEPQVALDAALKYQTVLGQTALAVAEVPRSAFCIWRRTIAQRVGRYALVLDELAFRVSSDQFEAQFMWQTEDHQWQPRQPGILTLEDQTNRVLVEIHTADPLPAQIHLPAKDMPGKSMWEPGGYTLQQWCSSVTRGAQRTFFTLLALKSSLPQLPLGCARVAGNAAALALPAPALAVVGKFAGVQGELVILAEDHLFGRAIRCVNDAGPDSKSGVLLIADHPVDADWDFDAGRLLVECQTETQVTLAVMADRTMRIGDPSYWQVPDERGLITLRLPGGRHVLENVRPQVGFLAQMGVHLACYLSGAKLGRAQGVPTRGAGTRKKTPPAPSDELAQSSVRLTVAGPVIDSLVAEVDTTPLIYVVAEQQVHVFYPSGRPLRSLSADGPIHMLHWWAEHQLLLVGCADDNVIAFDRQGKRRWTFHSEMDSAVTRAGKPYWFRSSLGHGGIQGLGSGVFLDGRSQAFVGSACTLEIIDEHGGLVKRLPQFWGTVHRFAIVPGPNGSLNLLASRRIADVADLAIINSHTLDPTRRGYQDVPPGTTNVDVWGNETSRHIFVEDVDGDGQPEIIREITGVWNRVTVWGLGGSPVGSFNYLNDIDFTRGPQEGTPKYNVHFGPGVAPTLGVNNTAVVAFDQTLIRDLDVVDLEGAGRKEILVALATGLLIALDGRCQRLWTARLTQAPTVIKVVGPTIVVGTEAGGVLGLDGSGKQVFSARVDGRVTGLVAVGVDCWVTTAKGEVAVFRVS